MFSGYHKSHFFIYLLFIMKQLLPIITMICICGSFSATFATEEVSSTAATVLDMANTYMTGTSSTTLSTQREAFLKRLQSIRETNSSLHQESKETLKEFRTENSGALHDMTKSNSGIIRDEVKRIYEERLNYVKSLSGMTLEMKAQYMSGVEDRIQKQIQTRFQNASGSLLAKRMEVYSENAARRSEILMNQLQIRADRGNLRSSEVDTFIAKITKEIPNLSAEKKTKLAKKIDEKIAKIQKNKRLPETNKTEIVAKLTTLRDALLK